MILAGPLGLHAEALWRCAFALGGVLAILVAGSRFYLLRETPAWEAVNLPEAQVASMAAGSSADTQADSHFNAMLAMKRALLGTMGSWLLFDIVSYGLSL